LVDLASELDQCNSITDQGRRVMTRHLKRTSAFDVSGEPRQPGLKRFDRLHQRDQLIAVAARLTAERVRIEVDLDRTLHRRLT
jgi:hypothetical protein